MASDLESVARKSEEIGCGGGGHKLYSGRMGRLSKGVGTRGAIGGVGIGSLSGKGLDSVLGGKIGSGEMLRKNLAGEDDLGLGDEISFGKTMKKSFAAKLDAALGEVRSAEAMRKSLGLGLALKGDLSLGGKMGSLERMSKSFMRKGDLSLAGGVGRGERLSKRLGGRGDAIVGVGIENEEKTEYDLEIPLKLMQEAEGHTIMMELKSGDKYHGALVECDDCWNCQLENAAYTSKDGKALTLANVFIRGRKIRFIVVPEMLRYAPMFKESYVQKEEVEDDLLFSLRLLHLTNYSQRMAADLDRYNQ